MIYVTGDTHIPIDISKLNATNFPEQKEMTKDDHLIICGDFGAIWDNGNEDLYWQDWLNTRNFTTLFVDGNHENFPLLYEYPVIDYKGGKVHQIRDSVYHLMRGEIFTIEDYKFFAMGGASSHDKEWRKEGVSWWPQEVPSVKELKNALINLTANDWSVDYIISHCCADSIQHMLSPDYEYDRLTKFFEETIKADCNYTRWFFGHYHDDVEIDDKHTCIYYNVLRIV